MKKKRLLALLLAMTLLVCFTGCGKDDSGASNELYICSHITMYGIDFAADEIYQNESSIVLKDGGKAVFKLDGEEFKSQWQVENGLLTLSTDGEELTGTVNEDVIILNNVFDSGMDMYFAREGVDIKQAVSAEENAQVAADPETYSEQQLQWNGNWYGWWSITNTTGLWEGVGDGSWWDCCAEISINEFGVGTFVMWDEESSKDDPIAQINISVSDDGTATSKSGYLYMHEFELGTWTLRLDDSGIDNMLVVDNAHYEAEDGSFDYVIYLRPWGETWNDIQESNPDLMPRHYADWYLPQLQGGVEVPGNIL